MRRLKIALLFISFFLWRWGSLENPLPIDWQEGDIARVTIPILDYPQQQDSRSIVRSGQWHIVIPGYTEFIPGDLVSFVGSVEPEEWGGKTHRVVMREAEPQLVEMREERKLPLIEYILIHLSELRRGATDRLGRLLPEPMASLASGILLGVRTTMPREFYEALIATGTIHVVAASGYNVTVVAGSIMGILSRLPRLLSIMGAVVGVVTYVLLAGAGPSIVRAGIMGSLTLIGHGLGRMVEARRLLFLSGMIMLIVEPRLIIDIGFQLSFAATLGILYLDPWIRGLQSSEPCNDVEKQGSELKTTGQEFLKNYLSPTLSATLATAPIIFWHFERVSWIGVGVNLLVLPVVPLIMLLSAVTLVVPWAAYLLYVPLWWMVSVIGWFG